MAGDELSMWIGFGVIWGGWAVALVGYALLRERRRRRIERDRLRMQRDWWILVGAGNHGAAAAKAQAMDRLEVERIEAGL